MEVTTLHVERRSAIGTKQVAKLRAHGRVPAVVYGGEIADTLPLSVDHHLVARELRHHHRVFRLEMDGKEQGVFLQDVQWDVLTDQPLHLDFRRIDLHKPMDVQVELRYVGHPKGASKGGTLIQDINDLHVISLPAAIPESIEVKVGELELGDKILAKELELPEGVSLAAGTEDSVVCHISMPEAEAAEEGAEGEGEAEGEEAPKAE